MAEYSSYAPNPEVQTPVVAPPVTSPTPATTPVVAPVANPYDTSRKDYGNLSYLLNQGMTQDQINSELAKGKGGAARGSFVDQQDIQRMLSTYNINPKQVYSASNVAQTVAGVAGKPNLSDPLAMYDYYLNSPEIQKAMVENKLAAEDVNKATATARNRQTALENLPQALNVIRGEQAQASRLSSDEIAALSENQLAKQSYLTALKETATNKFNVAKSMRDELTQMIVNNPGAKITYTDTPSSAANKIKKYQDRVAEDEYKKSLRSMAMQLGISTKTKKGGTLDAKGLEKAISKYYKGEADIKNELQQLEIAAKRKALAGGDGTVGQRTGAVVSQAQNALLSSRGSDGFVDPGVYASYRAKYASETGDVSGFDQQFGNLLSGAERNNLGIASAAKSNLTAAQKTQIADWDSTIQAANKAKEMAKNVNTGFFSGNIGKLGQTLGLASNNFVALNSQIASIKSNFMKAISGAAISASEKERLEQFLPDTTDSEQDLQIKTSQLISELSRQKENLELQGGGTGEIKVLRKADGQEGYISASEFDPNLYSRAY